MPPKRRWNGGIGYRDQKRMFDAILNVGWENIKHYVLLDGLDKESSRIVEALLIRNWKTYRPSKGYNAVVPQVDGMDGFELPKLKRIKIDDDREKSVVERYLYLVKHGGTLKPKASKAVRLVETGQIFSSVNAAAKEMLVKTTGIYNAARFGRACGTVWISDEDEGWRMEVPAHWEYIDKNTEEKEGSA